jgi:hypothetical protein
MSPINWDPKESKNDGPAKPLSIVKEIGQSFYLMGLMVVIMTAWVGLGLLAVHFLG